MRRAEAEGRCATKGVTEGPEAGLKATEPVSQGPQGFHGAIQTGFSAAEHAGSHAASGEAPSRRPAQGATEDWPTQAVGV